MPNTGTHPWEKHWTVLERLGKGGQGLTNRVTRKTDGFLAALKILKNNQANQARGRMKREVANLAVLAEAGGSVPKVYDDNTAEYQDLSTELFFVMDYFPGQTLAELVQSNGKLGLNDAAEVVLAICKTIIIAHTFPICHRDLKPENIIVRELATRDVVIVDYGLSFNANDEGVSKPGESIRNSFLSLPEHNTPSGNRRDPRSDITAARALLYFLITGHEVGLLHDGAGKPAHLRPGYSVREALGSASEVPQLELLFGRGFQAPLDSRFQTIEEFRDRLIQCTGGIAPTGIEDPIEVAARHSVIIRQRDRRTQLKEFNPAAGKVLHEIIKFANGFKGKLGRFLIDATDPSNAASEHPPGLDRIWASDIQANIQADHHPEEIRIIALTVCSRGEQCVVMMRIMEKKRGVRKASPLSDWEELLWFDPTTEPNLELVQGRLKQWINESIEALSERVVSETGR